MNLKEDWFEQWLVRDGYKFWYEEKDNEVWKNSKFVIVWHPKVGMRLMVSIDQFSEGYLCKRFIPHELAKQEQQ
jgi:hypothetical protein